MSGFETTTITPGTGAANLGKAEDAAHASADTGVAVLAVRKATPANLSDTDGDYEPLQISAGALWVADSAAGTSLAIIDDWDESDRAKVNPIVGQAGVAAGAGSVAATVQRVTLASDDPAVVALQRFSQAVEYETVAASQTAQVLGGTGATGDYIEGVLVVPATTSPGNVLLLDNAISITIFTGGASSVADIKPFYIPLRMVSVSGAWKITTGTNVSCIGMGNFSA